MRTVVLVVLAVDTVLLALTELAWTTGPSLALGPVVVPATAVVAAVTTPLLVRAADHVRPRTRAALVPVVLWTLTVVVVGLWSPAGGGVLPPDTRTIVLLAAGLFPGVLAATVRPAPAPSPDATPVATG